MNENQLLFSILIAHYNNWMYFQDCYKSIQDQTYTNYEIVIVDDYSTDGSYEKLLDLAQKDDKITLVRNERNQGVGFTKRRCIEISSGQICGFVDPDDALTTDALEESIDVYNKKEIGVTYSQMMLCDEDLNPNKPFPRTKKVANNDKWFFNVDTNVAHFFTFKRKHYDQTSGINVNLKSAVDQDLYLKLYENTDFYFINKPLYLYRLHAVGVSQGVQKSSAKDFFKEVLRDTFKRRSIEKINGLKVSELNNSELYIEIIKRHNQFSSKVLRKISTIFS